MKTIKKNVYYCDFCKKRSLRSLEKHEGRCTGNPNRSCGVCGREGKDLQPIVDAFKKRFIINSYFEVTEGTVYVVNWLVEPTTLDEIRKSVDNCPACILAVLRQTGMNRHYFKFEFDFKKELPIGMKRKEDRAF